MSSQYEIRPDQTALQPAPDWASRPWGRPTVHAADSEVNARLVGTVEFRYHGIRVRGVRIFENENGTMSVNMPQKRFGESIESVFYFVDPIEREQFSRDVVWLFCSVFGRRRRPRPKSGDAPPVATAV